MDINELRDAVLSALGQATDMVSGVANTTMDKAKSGGRMAKLAMDAASAREELKKTYLEIGKLYYDTHKDDPEGFFVQLFDEVRIAEEDLAAMEQELAALRSSIKSAAPTGESADEFERVVDAGTEDFAETATEAEAPKEPKEEVSDKVQNFRDSVAEKAGAVKDVVSEKAVVVKDAVIEKAGAVMDAVTEFAGEVRSKLNEGRSAAADAAEDVVEGAADAFEDVVDQVEDAAGQDKE
ncbi:MAG: hypothetical protein IJ705_04295 [Oscillospiraceae bacterium]|nr:hypothetical protein [Oscillospiraceae bacterium]